MRAGRIVTIAPPSTIADGAQTTQLGERNFAIISQRVEGVLTASDDGLVKTMAFFASRMKILVEPTGCLGLAGLRGASDLPGRRVAVILSGGNVDLARFAALVARGSEA